MNSILCLAIDVINPDKPAASLAFMSGVCEHLGLDYEPVSLNTELLLNFDRQQYDQVHAAMKLDDPDRLKAVLAPILPIIDQHVRSFQPDQILVSLFSLMQFPLAEIVLTHLRQQGFTGEIIAGGPGIQTKDVDGVTNGRKLLDLDCID